MATACATLNASDCVPHQVREDDTVEVAYDGVHADGLSNSKSFKRGTTKMEIVIDPRPDTVVRTSVPSYKAGQVSLVGLVTRFRHGCPPLIAVPFRARESLTSTSDH